MRFKVKVLKRFKFSTGCHIETCRSLKRRAFLKIPSTVFRRIYALSVCFKMKSLKKHFPVLKQNQPKFCYKTCWKEQPFIATVYLMNYIFQTSMLFNTWSELIETQFFPVIIVKQLLISVSVIARWDSISAFSSLIGVPIGIVVL